MEISPPALHHDANRTSLLYDVKACSDARVILYAVYLKPRPKASVIQIVLGKNGQSKSTIENCTSECLARSWPRSTEENPLHCNESKRFLVQWEKGEVEVFRFQENQTWGRFLHYSSTALVKLYGVFIAYKLYDDVDNSTVSEWTIQSPCPEPEVVPPKDSSSSVSQGHLAGAVIASLLAGILIGVLCVCYGPKLITYIREGNFPWKKKKTEDAQTEDELVELQSQQAKPQESAQSPADAAADGSTARDLALPGDNPPPAAAPATKRKASNTYTPYHQMGGGAEAPKKEKVTKPTAHVKDPVQRTTSGRAMSPLPPLPGDDVSSAAAAPTQDDLYINADAHVYAGMQHEAPIYENRNAEEYEVLQASPPKKKGK